MKKMTKISLVALLIATVIGACFALVACNDGDSNLQAVAALDLLQDDFGIAVKKDYLSKEDEIKILVNATKVSSERALDMVNFANSVREAFDAGKISDTISPRTLLFATKLGIMHASFTLGLTLAFMNKLSTVDRETCQSFAQRIFGDE